MSDAPAKDALANVPPVSGAVAEPAADNECRDVVLLGPPTADGAGVHVIRAREERIETGELRALQEGRPIAGEIVTLAPRKENPRVCDVKDSWAPREAVQKGPAKVATNAYREGWDEVFGKKPARGKSDAN
jgi:hypothetical protein